MVLSIACLLDLEDVNLFVALPWKRQSLRELDFISYVSLYVGT